MLRVADGTEADQRLQALAHAAGCAPGATRACGGAVGGALYVCGGVDARGCTASVEALDVGPPRGRRRVAAWRPVAPMQRARHSAAAGVVGSRLLVVGGLDGVHGGVALAAAEAYDPRADA